MNTPNPNPSPELREARNRLSDFEQMNDAQAGCLPCKLCGGKAVVTDAGTGGGYYVRCENSTNFRDYKGCMIDERRLSGWAYNVMEWWNRLHAQTATLPTDAQVREAMQTAWDDYCDDAKAFPGDLTKLSRGRIMFTAGTWADHTAMHLRAALSPQTLPAPGEVANLRTRLVAAEHAASKWEQACQQSWDREALATVAAANDEGVAEQAAQFADGVAEGAQSLYDLAARDRDTVGTLIHGEAVRVAKHIAAAIRLLPQGGGKA